MDITIKRPDTVSFGIYQCTKYTDYGKWIKGKYKGYHIEIYDDQIDNAKLYYVSDKLRKWVMSKLVYFKDGIKKITRSYSNGV